MSPAGGGRMADHLKLSIGGGLNAHLIVHFFYRNDCPPLSVNTFKSKYFPRPDSDREGQ